MSARVSSASSLQNYKWISWCPTWNFQHLGEVPFPGHPDQAVAPIADRRPLRDGHSLSCTLHWGDSPREGEGHSGSCCPCRVPFLGPNSVSAIPLTFSTSLSP